MSAARLLDPRTLERLSRLDLGSRRVGGGREGGERPSGASGAGTLFREHRTYSPGDDLRYVDWNAYGRLRTLHVKVFEHEESLDVHLLLDRSASMGAGPGSKLEAAARVAAMVGSVGLARGATVRLQLLSGGTDAAGDRRAFRGRGATALFVEALRSAPSGGSAPLGRSLRAAFPRLRRRGFALLVTDFLDSSGGREGWRRAADFLLYRGVELSAVQVVAPEERRPVLDGSLRLVDSESGETLDVELDAEMLALYEERFERRIRQIAAYLRSREARHLVVETSAAREPELLRQLLRCGVLR